MRPKLIRRTLLASIAAMSLFTVSQSPFSLHASEADGRDWGDAATSAGDNGKTELMQAARGRELERLQALLNAGADANLANDNGGTPLMYAVLGGDLEIVHVLLDRGADFDARADNGWSATMIAAAKGYDHILELLLARGADPNAPDVYQWTPLMRAGYENRPAIVRLLLQDDRVDINRRGEKGFTALHLAATQGHLEIVRLLLAAGADRNIRDADGRTAYEFATQRQQPELLDVFRNARISSR